MKNTNLLFALGLALLLSGCMATLSPDGTITAEYIEPEPSIVIEQPAPIIYAHNAPRPAPPRPAPRLVPPRPSPKGPHRAHGPMGHGRF